MKNVQLTLKKEHLNYLMNNPYVYRNRFAFVYEPMEENKVKLNEWMELCREVICDRIRTLFNIKKTFDVRKLRLITHTKFFGCYENAELSKRQRSYIETRKVSYVKGVLISIKILNLIEREFKWPLTKIYLAKCKQVDDFNNAFYYFEGSRKWVKSPNLFSLFMLILRVGSSLKEHTKFRTLDGFYRCLRRNKSTLDVNYLKMHYKRYLLAIKYYDRLFGKVSMRELYIPNQNLDQFAEGLNTLCDLNTNNLDLRVKFAKILDEGKMLEHWEKDKLIKKGSKK